MYKNSGYKDEEDLVLSITSWKAHINLVGHLSGA